MLRRRNTIHPSQQQQPQRLPSKHHQRHNSQHSFAPIHPFAPIHTTTNPFLESSPSWDKTKAQQTSPSTPVQKTNPFLHDSAPIPTPQQQQEYSIHPFDLPPDERHYQEHTPGQTGVETEEHVHGHGQEVITGTKGWVRRLKQQPLFKPPFGWSPGRRATWASLHRKERQSSTAETAYSPADDASFYAQLEQKGYQTQCSLANGSDSSHEQILKTAGYSPDMAGDEVNHPEDYGSEVGGWSPVESAPSSGQGESFNPFLNDEGQVSENAFQEHEDNYTSNTMSMQSSCPPPVGRKAANAIPPRRRHSEFSDWSIEDCPELLAAHVKAKQQQERRRGSTEEGNPLGAVGSMARSRTVAGMGRQQSHQGHDILHRPASVFQPRRHSVAGRIHPPPASAPASRSRRSHYDPEIQSAKSTSYDQTTQEHDFEGTAYYDPFDTNQDPFSEQQAPPQTPPSPPRYPASRSSSMSASSWQQYQSLRQNRPWARETNSYADDFKKESERRRPRAWTGSSWATAPAAYSTCAPSMLRCASDHDDEEEEDEGSRFGEDKDWRSRRASTQRNGSRRQSRLDRDMKEIQMRPYGHEDDDDDDDNDGDDDGDNDNDRKEQEGVKDPAAVLGATYEDQEADYTGMVEVYDNMSISVSSHHHHHPHHEGDNNSETLYPSEWYASSSSHGSMSSHPTIEEEGSEKQGRRRGGHGARRASAYTQWMLQQSAKQSKKLLRKISMGSQRLRRYSDSKMSAFASDYLK